MAPLWATHPTQRSDQARCQPARLLQVTAGASQRLEAHKLVRSLWLLAERVCGPPGAVKLRLGEAGLSPSPREAGRTCGRSHLNVWEKLWTASTIKARGYDVNSM